MATKKVTSKNEFSKIANGLTIQEQGKGYEHCAPVYEYREGSFSCSIDTYNSSIEEQMDKLKHTANCIDRIGIKSNAELNRRSNSLQNALAYIGQHRELIPFLDYVAAKVESGMDSDKAAREYGKQHPDMSEAVKDYAHDKSTFAMWYINGKGAPPLQVVLKQLPYLPTAWRRA